jgi:hypothetical protein
MTSQERTAMRAEEKRLARQATRARDLWADRHLTASEADRAARCFTRRAHALTER